MKKSNADYQREFAERQKAAGLVKISVWVKPKDREKVKAIEQKSR